jgi:hypothetical protein
MNAARIAPIRRYTERTLRMGAVLSFFFKQRVPPRGLLLKLAGAIVVAVAATRV